jgi:hypothetical protein
MNFPYRLFYKHFLFITTFLSALNSQAITERSYENNVGFINLSIGARTPVPDLIVEKIVAPQNNVDVPGNTGDWDVSFTVFNAGPGAGGSTVACKARIYVSKDRILSNDDIQIAEENVPVLISGENTVITSTITIPASFSGSGHCWILFKVDATNLVTEQNEKNNINMQPIKIAGSDEMDADLVIEEFTSPTQHSVGSPSGKWEIAFNVQNVGINSTGATKAYYILSSDIYYDNKDIKIGEISVPALGNGSTKSIVDTISIPSGIQVGFYNILIVPNPEKVISSVKSYSAKIPLDMYVFQNYPNPFNPSTAIRFVIPNRSNVKVQIFNTLGQTIATLLNEQKDAGYYEATWNAVNQSSGVYFYRIEATALDNPSNRFVETKKMILLR